MDATLSFIRTSERAAPLANVAVLGQADPTAGRVRLPLFLSRVSAGFPSPADDYLEGKLSLDEHLVSRPEATFFLRVQGDSMVGAGIHDGDLLIVDKSLTPRHGSIVIAEVHGKLTVKRLYRKNGKISLLAENPAYRYQKAGVMLMGLSDAKTTQSDVFAPPSVRTPGKSQRLMATLDRINRKMGRGTLRLAAEGLRQDWRARTDYPSPRYTTRWADLPIAHA